MARTFHDFVTNKYFDLESEEFAEPVKGNKLSDIYSSILCSLIIKASWNANSGQKKVNEYNYCHEQSYILWFVHS